MMWDFFRQHKITAIEQLSDEDKAKFALDKVQLLTGDLSGAGAGLIQQQNQIGVPPGQPSPGVIDKPNPGVIDEPDRGVIDKPKPGVINEPNGLAPESKDKINDDGKTFLGQVQYVLKVGSRGARVIIPVMQVWVSVRGKLTMAPKEQMLQEQQELVRKRIDHCKQQSLHPDTLQPLTSKDLEDMPWFGMAEEDEEMSVDEL
ncbi:MAG: hypothetical protein Q9213_007515 [Squamulea squamosa]